MTARLFVLSVMFLASAAYRTSAMRPEVVGVRAPLAAVPATLGSWSGHDDPRLSEEVLAVLGADEYLLRTYRHQDEPPISLYIGFYQSQRHGDTIHSPMNCLPGAGWLPVSAGRARIPVARHDQPIEVNRYLIQKGLDRQLVLYWYQSHGRVVASEYWSKAYLVYDAMRANRSDAALVRVITPVLPSEDGEEAAERRAVGFVQTLFPLLDVYLPS